MKENEVKIFSVIVDAEGNDKWIAGGVFVDKPKLKTEVKPEDGNARLIQGILNAAGLNKKGIELRTLSVDTYSPQSVQITVHYFDLNCNRSRDYLTKVIHVHG